VAFIAVSIGTTAVAQETSRLTLDISDTSAYPEITLAVTLPAEMLAETGPAPTFSVLENGEPVDVVAVRSQVDAQVPQDVVLLFDTSGSMAGVPLDDAKAAASAFLSAMAPDDRVALVSFSDNSEVLYEFTTDRAGLLAAINGLEAAGQTSVYDALVTASSVAARSDRHVTLVLLSDGADNRSINTFDAAVQKVKTSGGPLFVVALESEKWDPRALQLLAAESAGRYLGTADSGDLVTLYQGIAEELRNRYLVTYTSAGRNTKDLEVVVTGTRGAWTAGGSIVNPNPLYSAPVDWDAPPIEEPRPSIWVRVLAVFLVLLSMGLFVGALGFMITRPSARLDRIEFYDQTRRVEPTRDNLAGDPETLRGRLMEAVGEVAGRRGFTKTLREQLERAGLPLRPVEYIYLHLVVVFGLSLIALLLTGNGLLAIIIALVTIFVPIFWLQSRVDQRRRHFDDQLPEILNLLAGSLRVGWGMQQAIGLVTEQMAPPASVEFKRVLTEARLGLSVEEALEKMADRLGSEEFRWVVTAINIQREVGGNLAEVLDIVAQTMRARAELRRHIKALTAEGRLSGIILLALPFVELLVLLTVNPTYMAGMFSHPLGWTIALVGVVLMIVGTIWLRKALAVEV
jgi:tight adherence protein B